MRLNILFPIKNEPTGGGNQFLLALRKQLQAMDAYIDNPGDADVLLFNSYPFGSAASLYHLVTNLKHSKSKDIAVIHRVDGPISVVRGNSRDVVVDRSIALFNQLNADATIYQSAWSRDVCMAFGVGLHQHNIIIPNAPDPTFFYPSQSNPLSSGSRIKIAITSWSSNWRKGFDIYRYLDQHLDFNRYTLTFIGNSPIKFNNIQQYSALSSKELGETLRRHDMFLTASIDDPCSNALIEALHCKLPVVALKSGGHPELVGTGGVLFDGYNDVIDAIERCAANIEYLKSMIYVPTISEIAQQYLSFSETILKTKNVNSPAVKSSQLITQIAMLISVAKQRYYPALTRRICSRTPVREERFYRHIPALRHATWEPTSRDYWNESVARKWLHGVQSRLPVFLDSMRHSKKADLYKFSYSGDLQALPSLAASVFIAKIRTMTGLLDTQSTRTLAEHIISFGKNDGSIADPWVSRHSKLRRILMAARTRNTNNLFNDETIRAETRQSFAALCCLGSRPELPYAKMPSSRQDIEAYIERLDWSRPWGASSHISHLVFFLHHHALWFGIEPRFAIQEIFNLLETRYRRDDGGWYAKGSIVSPSNKVNGAMKMVTALDASGIDTLANPEGLIDLCLGVINDGHACNHFNVVCVLHRCQKLTDYRKADIHTYCLDRLMRYREHYWPWQGGFSFYPQGANDSYYNARVSTGMAEPDAHGTVLILWGIVLITEILGWGSEFNFNRPWT